MKLSAQTTGGRRGITSVIAVGTLVMLGLVGGVLVRQAMMQEKRLREDERQAQADWLVQAGLERAWVRLRIDPAYEGDVWEIGPDELGGAAGRVEINVVGRGDEGGTGREVRVSAVYPVGGPRGARSSGTFQVELGTKEEGGAP